MARKRKAKAQLEQAAIKIGTALGKATRAARVAGETTPRARKELAQVKKSLRALVQELESATKRVKKALR